MELNTQGLETAHRAYVRRRSQMAQIDTTDSIRDRLALIAAIRAYVLATHPASQPATHPASQPPSLSPAQPPAMSPVQPLTPRPEVRGVASDGRMQRTTVIVPLDTFVFEEG